MKIALVCCFWNEETEITDMLHSCYGAIDHVVLMDNASTDRSRMLAEYYCVKAGLPYTVLVEPESCGWPDHLYNSALDAAQGLGCDWTLLLDADERLTGHARKHLREMAENVEVDAYYVPRRTFIEPYCPTAGGEIQPYTDSIEINEHHYRFFRSNAVRYPQAEGPHHPPRPLEGKRTRELMSAPTWILHYRDGWEQQRRDKGRDQNPETPLAPLWTTIGGWFDYQAIYDLAVSEAMPGGTLVELGNYLGRSLVYLGQRAKESGKGLKIVGVDLYRSEPNPYMHTEVFATASRWLHATAANVHRAGLSDDVSLLQWSSWEAAKLFDEQSVDFVFVDACHEAYAVKNDLEAWYPKLKRGSLFAGHDYSSLFPQLMEVVDAFCLDHGLKIDTETSPGSWLVRKP